MLKAISCTLLVASTLAGACREADLSPGAEQPAPPDTFVVTTRAGERLLGAAARIDIKHQRRGEAPEIEITVSASSELGSTWAVQAAALPDFLRSRVLSADVVDRPLDGGTASVQVAKARADAAFSPAGRLQLRIDGGRLIGEVSGAANDFAASFAGPVVVTCAVPSEAMASGAPAPTSANTATVLVVDTMFESALCRPYADLAGGGK
jgi:hypothetical protein